MTTPENPVAALLQRAAEDMKAKASAATPGPWWSDDSPECWRLHGVHGYTPAMPGLGIKPQVINHQILKAPKHGTPYAEYWPGEADAAWITGMHPGVGLAVAGWLEAEAGRASSAVHLAPECGHAGEPCEEACGMAWWCGQCEMPRRRGGCGCWDPAVAVARAWLGETTETGEGPHDAGV